MHRNTQTCFLIISLSLALPSRDLETQQRFTRTYFTHKTTYAYLALFTDCWNIQKIRFKPMLGRWRSILRKFSAIFHFGATDPILPLFLLHLSTVFVEVHLLSTWKTWQLWISKSYKVFMEAHNTLVTHYVRKGSQSQISSVIGAASPSRFRPLGQAQLCSRGPQRSSIDRPDQFV